MPHSSRRSCIAECAYWIVGCGPGTITLDFAELVAPGRVLGIDLEPTQLNYAQRRSREQQLNASFAVASVAKRPFSKPSPPSDSGALGAGNRFLMSRD
jgi:precorrin-6B methylase 2